MKNNQVEGYLGDISERSESVVAIVYIPKNPPKPKGFEEMTRDEQASYIKSSSYQKAKGAIKKKLGSLHLGGITISQEE